MSGALLRVRGSNVRRTGGQGQRSVGASAAPRRRQGALSAGSRRALPRSGSGALLLAAKAGGVAGLGVIIAVGLFVIRLLNGPISLPFLVGPIERAIAEEMGGLRVGIEDVAVRLGGGGQWE